MRGFVTQCGMLTSSKVDGQYESRRSHLAWYMKKVDILLEDGKALSSTPY
jgi:hypothetical protein